MTNKKIDGSILRKYITDNIHLTGAEIRDLVLKDYPNIDTDYVRKCVNNMRRRDWFKVLLKETPSDGEKESRDHVAEVKDALVEGLTMRDAELRVYLSIPLKEWESLRVNSKLNDYRLEVKSGPNKGLWWANPVSIEEIQERCDVL